MNINSWFKTLSFASELFRRANIEHMFIKLLISPLATMTDIDILIPNPFEEIKALRSLEKHNFKFFKPRLLSHPLKIMCKKNEFTTIDIYPDVMWIRKKVASGMNIVTRRVLTNINGIEVYTPSPEDSFYIIATHAYSHLSIKLEEVKNCAIIINSKNFSLDYLYDLSSTYGTLDAIYLFLKILSEFNLVEKDVLKNFLNTRICKITNSWLSKQKVEFPLEVPTWLGCVLSSFYHTPKAMKKIKLKEAINDFFTHYLSLSSKKLLGST